MLVYVLTLPVAWAARGRGTTLPHARQHLSHSVGPSDSTSSLRELRTDTPAGTSEVDLNAIESLDRQREETRGVLHQRLEVLSSEELQMIPADSRTQS